MLAPMEGLLDFMLRDVLTRSGGVSRCVSEFIRVTDRLLPDRVFHRVVPELLADGCTPSGVPVRPQLLGSDPNCLADNAARLAELGRHGVDLNFGCPAKIVNRHGGGAALLDDPELLHRILLAVRRAVPVGTAVSAKMRLGNQDDRRAVECAQALVDGGADELVVHARTKAHGYRPPAFWERVADIHQAVAVPVVANGEIWNVSDALNCRHASGCSALMLGRGMVADPGLALAILSVHQTSPPGAPSTSFVGLDWHQISALLMGFSELVDEHIIAKHRAGRLKQWLNFLRRRYPQAQEIYERTRVVGDSRLIMQAVTISAQSLE